MKRSKNEGGLFLLLPKSDNQGGKMKEKELRELAECKMCGKPIGACGIPLFYKVTVSRYGLRADALKRQAGMEMMMNGNVAIAQAMGRNENLAECVMKEKTFSICEACAGEKTTVHSIALERK
jgi:hypothetical protein